MITPPARPAPLLQRIPLQRLLRPKPNRHAAAADARLALRLRQRARPPEIHGSLGQLKIEAGHASSRSHPVSGRTRRLRPLSNGSRCWPWSPALPPRPSAATPFSTSSPPPMKTGSPASTSSPANCACCSTSRPPSPSAASSTPRSTPPRRRFPARPLKPTNCRPSPAWPTT